LKFTMNIAYHFDVPAPSAGFCEGGRLVFAGQFPGKGTSKGDETRRGRTLVVAGYRLPVAEEARRNLQRLGNRQPATGNGGSPCPR
jgi:hypothetical protein